MATVSTWSDSLVPKPLRSCLLYLTVSWALENPILWPHWRVLFYCVYLTFPNFEFLLLLWPSSHPSQILTVTSAGPQAGPQAGPRAGPQAGYVRAAHACFLHDFSFSRLLSSGQQWLSSYLYICCYCSCHSWKFCLAFFCDNPPWEVSLPSGYSFCDS